MDFERGSRDRKRRRFVRMVSNDQTCAGVGFSRSDTKPQNLLETQKAFRKSKIV